jgi:hypothetical protein
MKEFKMSDSSQPNNKSGAIVMKTDRSLDWGPDIGFQGKIATMLVQDSCTPLEIRLEKVLEIQRLLTKAGHNLDKQQDTILKQLLETLNT